MATAPAQRRLTVAITGPTGDIGLPLLERLDRNPAVGRVIGMARRPFDPAEHGLTKTEYRQGEVLDRASVDGLVKDADVVVHLAFLIFGTPDEARAVNLEGSNNVFGAAFDAGVQRLLYTSSVAAYGFHEDHPDRLTEDVPARGSDSHYYSAQKADVEGVLDDLRRGATSGPDVYVFRPCIVAGPGATTLIEKLPYVKFGDRVPNAMKKLAGSMPLLRPVLPDPGVPFQLVHEDDVAAALELAVLGRGEPGVYNLAADGDITVTDLAHALGWYAVPVPQRAMDVTATIMSSLPLLPAEAKWLEAIRVPVLMDTTKARTVLGWEPEHDVLDTLAATVHAARLKGIVAAGRAGPAEVGL
ncbi:MAG: NAD-dependent epimerase/dehydratase family protein [Actinomycetota bacterium]